LSVIGLVFASPLAHAADFSRADSLFAQRESSRGVIAEARQAYLEILGMTADVNEKIRAAEQLGKLAIYEGELLLPKSDSAGRQAIFGECWCKEASIVRRACTTPGFIEQISPKAIGRMVPAYAYYYGACLGYWGESANLMQKAAFSGELGNAVKSGISIEESAYEGGGVHRLAGSVWSNPLARAVGLYDIDGAYREIEQAIAAPAYQDQHPGSLYFENIMIKLKIMSVLDGARSGEGWKDKAIQLADDTLADMADRVDLGKVPVGREPEFRVIQTRIEQFYQEQSGKSWTK
jgi:hypothetical protein